MLARTALLAAALGLSLIPATASAYVAQNGYVVKSDDAGGVMVMPKGRLGVADAWCAAGDFTIRVLSMPGTTRIWRITPVPRTKGEPMHFSFSPEGAETDTGMLTVGGPQDGSMSATLAQQICWTVGFHPLSDKK